MSDPRKELAEIARATRHYLERERAAGLGDLLAEGAARAAPPETPPSGPFGPPRSPARPTPAGDPAGLARAATSGRPSVAGVGSPAAAGGLHGGEAGGAGGASSAPRTRARPVATNLFGEPEPEPVPRRSAALAPEDPTLGIFEEGLNPGGLLPRESLAAESLPVLEEIAAEARACTRCGLCGARTQAVPGVGTARSGIVFVGEAPGADEDRLGEPFVGRAGQLLDRIIKAVDDARLIPGVPLDRRTVYICNVLKCRPPENRNPLPHEVESCAPYLRRQLEALRPRVICCLGKIAAELLVGVRGTIGALRGRVYRYQGAKLIVTYHPAACLRNPAYKRPVWEDMRLLAREYLSD